MKGKSSRHFKILRQRSDRSVKRVSLPSDIKDILAKHPQQSTAVLRGAFNLPQKLVDGSIAHSHLEPRKYKLIDLFAGAGGFTLGFLQTGRFEPVFGNDFNRYAVKTYNANFVGDHCIDGDINEILSGKTVRLPKADVVIGGPPCQGFSLLNKQRNGDPRKELWRSFFEVVERVSPAVFVMENVPELLSSEEFGLIRNRAESLGYIIESDVLNAANYGVPQRRKRAIVIGSLKGVPKLPSPTHIDPAKVSTFFGRGLLPWESVGRAIGDLGDPEGTEIRVGLVPVPIDLHFGRTPTKKSLERYRCIPEGGNRIDLQRNRPDITPDCWVRKKSGGTDLFGRLWWDRPAFTIRTEFFKPEKGRYLHPRKHRPISHREAARLQSFPDDFVFLGTKIEVAKQIGNAVPPLLSKRIAESVLEHLIETHS